MSVWGICLPDVWIRSLSPKPPAALCLVLPSVIWPALCPVGRPVACKSSGTGIEGRVLGLEDVSLSGESATLSQSCRTRSSAGVRNGDLPAEPLSRVPLSKALA